MADKKFYITNANVSRFLIPFYLDPAFERKQGILFNAEDWERTGRRSIYLTQYIQEIYRNSDDGICVFYDLKKPKWADYGLPADPSEVIQLRSCIIDEQPESHTFRIIDISAAYFLTGIGFLLLDIRHNDDASFQEIVDTCFALSNIFSKNFKTQESKVEFFCSQNKTTIKFTMEDVVSAILKRKQLEKQLEIFPTNKRMKLNAYHRFLRPFHKKNEDRLIYNLTRGVHSSAPLQKEKYDFLESDFRLSHNEDSMWSIGSNSAISISYENKDNLPYLTEKHPRHVDIDYFLVYLLAMHEREILLKYNYDAVKNWKNARKLVLMKDELVRFNILFSYNTVSVESSYQDFYECMYHALKLEKLECDIQDVIVQVNEAVNASRERKVNALLSSIAVLAVLSAAIDGFGFIDRLYDPASLQAGHYIVMTLIMVVVSYGIFYFFRGKK